MQLKIPVMNRHEAVAVLNAFANRGSFSIQLNGHFDVFVRCDEDEARGRLAGVLPGAEVVVLDRDGVGRKH